MKEIWLAIFLLSTLPGAMWSQLSDLGNTPVNSVLSNPDQQNCQPELIFNTVQPGPAGLCVRGNEVWVSGNIGQNFNSDGLITRHDLASGEIDTVFSVALDMANLSGMHLQADTLWVINEEDTLLYKLNAYTGELYEQFTPPYLDRNIWGITGDGTYLYISEYRALNDFTFIYQFDPQTATTKDTIIISENRSILGLEYVNGKFYGVGPIEVDSLLEIDPSTGSITNRYPWCIPAATGISYDPSSADFFGVSASIFGGDTAVYRITNPLVSNAPEIDQPTIEVTVFPNPVLQDQIQLKLNQFGHYQLRIYNGSGQLLRQQALSGTHFNLKIDSFPAGIYWLSITDGKRLITKSFIKP